MKYEKSVGAIIFREGKTSNKVADNKQTREYLLLAYPGMTDKEKVYWGFPKGHVDENESELETAQREIAEETSLSEFSLVGGFKEKEKYLFKRDGEFVSKTSVYFLVQTTSDDVKISAEHLSFEGLPFRKALAKLSFKEARQLLQKAEEFLGDGAGRRQGSLI